MSYDHYIDAHIHSWNPKISPDVLVYDRFPQLNKTLEAKDAETVLKPLGFSAAILIQSEPSVAHSGYCVEQMRGNKFVHAVSGWLDPLIDHKDTELRTYAKECSGTRMMLNRMTLNPEIEQDLIVFCNRLGEHGVVVDLLATMAHVDIVERLVHACDGTLFIMDHSAQPNTADIPEARWVQHMNRLGQCTNVYNKVSGLLENSNGSSVNVNRHLDVLFSEFDAQRLMLASNWPIINLFGGMAHWLELVNEACATLDNTSKSAIYRDTCLSLFR